MENTLLQISALIEKVESCVDGGWKLRVYTQELTEEQAGTLLKLNRKLGWFVFKETPLEATDVLKIPEITPEFKEDKSPSQRLRARMFVYYKKKKGTEEGFNQWYDSTLNKIGQTYLDKLEDEK